MSNSGNFIYTISGTFNNEIPIINNNNSFTTLTPTISGTTVNIYYEYNNINSNDGLTLYNFAPGYDILKLIKIEL